MIRLDRICEKGPYSNDAQLKPLIFIVPNYYQPEYLHALR